MIEVLNCYEKLVNNYLESLYLQFMLIYNDNEIVIKAIYRSFEKMFIVNSDYINYLSFRHKLLDNINCQLKPYMNIKQENNKYVIDDRIYLFNFNVHKYFNELDNKIMIYLLINGFELSKVASLLNYKQDYISERFYSIVNWMKAYFNNVIKPQFAYNK